MNIDISQIKKSPLEDRKKILEDCLNDLAKVYEFSQSDVFKRFLEAKDTKTSYNWAQIKSQENQTKELERQESDLDSGDDYLGESGEGESVDEIETNENIEEENNQSSGKELKKDLLITPKSTNRPQNNYNKVKKSISLVGQGFDN